MKTLVYNKDNLLNEDINSLSIRVKALIINKDKLIIGNEDGIYQFIGGHVEDNEDYISALKREIKEESGIEINNEEISGPFYKISYFNKDYPVLGINKRNDIYYYVVKTNKNVNLDNTSYTENESNKHYKILELNLDNSVFLIEKNMSVNPGSEVISKDMIIVLKEYLGK